MTNDYTMESKQEPMLLQLKLEKTYDNVGWSFINRLMFHPLMWREMTKWFWQYLPP